MSLKSKDASGVGSCVMEITIWGFSVAVCLLALLSCQQKPLVTAEAAAVSEAPSLPLVMRAAQPVSTSEQFPSGDFTEEIIATMLVNDGLNDERVAAQLDQDDIEISIADQKAEILTWDKKRLAELTSLAMTRFDGDGDGKLVNVELAAARSSLVSKIMSMKARVGANWQKTSILLCPDVAVALKTMSPRGGLYVLYERVAVRCAGIVLPDGVALGRIAFCHHIQSSIKEKGQFSALLGPISDHCASMLSQVQKS